LWNCRQRKIRRRREWLANWQAVAYTSDRGGYSDERIEVQLRELRAELALLL
jgi:hypothetical protein